jgi:hypothetical protein
MSNLNEAQFDPVLKSYTFVGDKSRWRNIADSLRRGEKPDGTDEEVSNVNKLVSMVKQRSTPTEGYRLYSGVNLKRGVKIPSVGDTVTHALQSTTPKDTLAQKFSNGDGKPVVYHYAPGTKAVNISKYSMFGDEQEHLVSGDFEVYDKYKTGKVTHAYLRPRE